MSNPDFTSVFKCEYCKLDLTGSQQYQQHIQGKKHLKRLKATGVANLTALQGQGTARGQDKGDVISGYGGKFVTSADNKGEGDDSSNGTRSDKLGEVKKQVLSKQSVGVAKVPNVFGTSDPVMNAVHANLLGSLPLKKAVYEGNCDYCNVKYSSKTHEEQHISGKNHAKKVRNSSGPSKLNAATFFCGFCNMQLNSIQQMDQHREGTAHKKKVENAKKTQTDQKDIQPPPAKKKFDPLELSVAEAEANLQKTMTEITNQQTTTQITNHQTTTPSAMPKPPAELVKLNPLAYDK